MEKKKRGKIKIALFLSIIVLLLASTVFLLIKEKTRTKDVIEESSPPFKVDQILLKVLIKEDESMVRPINIMDISNYDLYIEIEAQNLYNIVSVSDNKFSLKTGQTKTVYINFSSFVKEKGIRQEPGIYIGGLIIKSDSEMEKTPVIIEIETKEILFDVNVEIPIEQRRIEQGDYLNVHVTLFNLKKIGLTNLNIEYSIRDVFGNTIITETESITVETQASFVKTMHIPENLNPGEYVFGAIVRYGSSTGTSTLLFEVTKQPLKEKNLFDYCKDNIFCWIILVVLVMIIIIITSYIHFLIGAFIHHKVIHQLKKETKEGLKKTEKLGKKKKPLKHKKIILMLLMIIALISVIVYLFYSKIITLEKVAYLWNLTINWLKNLLQKILSYTRDLWKVTLYYLSHQRRYFYYVLYLITSLIALICLILIIKKISLFKKLKQRKAKKEEKKLVKRLEAKKTIKKKKISERGKLANFYLKLSENFEKLSVKEKITIIIMLCIIFLIIIVSILIEAGKLSSKQVSIENVALNIRLALNTMLEWIIIYYLYILIAALVMDIIIWYHIKKDVITEHKKLFLAILMIFALIAVIAYLFYNGIITLEQINRLWNNISYYGLKFT